MLDPADRDAQLAYEAIKELSTPASKLVIIEISCTRSSFDLFKVRQAYMTHYKKSLEEDVAYQTTGDFGKVNDLFSQVVLNSSSQFTCSTCSFFFFN